jgi:predicted transcriptional regulator
MQGLRDCSPHDWQLETVRLTGQFVKRELLSLINNTAVNNMQLLANMMNSSLQQVSRDLSPLSAKIIHGGI